MAAIVTPNAMQIIAGGARAQTGIVDFNGDATANIPVTLAQVLGASFVELGLAGTVGSVDMPSIELDPVGEAVPVPATGLIPVGLAAAGSRKFLYTFWGW